MGRNRNTGANTQNNTTGRAADTCSNGHIAKDGQCSIGWCAFNKWPQTWPENKTR